MATAESAVQLTITLWVQKLAVGCTVVPSEDLRDDMVAMPTCFPRDRETTDGAISALSPPQVEQDCTARKGVGHVPAFALLEVQLPCRMVWVRGSPYLGVQMERQRRGVKEPHCLLCPGRLPPSSRLLQHPQIELLEPLRIGHHLDSGNLAIRNGEPECPEQSQAAENGATVSLTDQACRGEMKVLLVKLSGPALHVAGALGLYRWPADRRSHAWFVHNHPLKNDLPVPLCGRNHEEKKQGAYEAQPAGLS